MTPRPIDSVLRLAAMGWRLLPCAERAKTPLIRDWPRRASYDADIIRRWAQKYAGCNWAVACGADSGVWILDVDGSPGSASFCLLVSQYGADWTRTLAVTTARGKHFYFSYPATGEIRNSAGKLGVGLDVRGEGGYVLCPPSIHPSGALYEWTSPLNGHAPASAPAWLLERVTVTSAARPAIQAAEVGIIPEGRRNDTLTRAGGYLRRKGLSLPEIEIELLERNARRCRPPLAEQEVRQIALSVSRYPVGGPDPLEQAWAATEAQICSSNYERFVALALELQLARPGQPVALPLKRIADLLGCDWTQPRAYRKRAVLTGILHRAGDYIPHRRAATYRVTHPLREFENVTPTTEHPLITPTTGLVGDCDFPVVGEQREKPVVGDMAPVVGEQSFPSERKSSEISCDVEIKNGKPQTPAPRCYVHPVTEWWKRIDGDLVCNRCHPKLQPSNFGQLAKGAAV